jgi:L-lactate dehydrogenase complex protein LldG
MSDARSDVLLRIRGAIGDTEARPIVREYRRLGQHPVGSGPVVDLFAERVEDYNATVVRCADDPAEIARCIREQFAARGIERCLLAPGLTGEFADLLPGAAPDHAGIGVRDLDTTPAVVTASVASIAETGTIILDASPVCGRRALSLVPDVHVCLVARHTIAGTVPEALALVDRTAPPTTISGPSATSDIELHRVEGVHGPRTLIVVIIGADA